MNNGIVIEVLDGNNQPKNFPAVMPQGQDGESLATTLANALISRESELDSLKLRFIDSNLSGKEKLEEILKFKSMLMLPSLKGSMGFYIDSELLRGSADLLVILTSIEATIKNIIHYEETENIDFNHPKIVSGFNMLFEMVMECIVEVIKEPVLVREIAEKCAVRAVGIEAELNKTFKSVANKMAQSVDNPLTQSFKNKNKDIGTSLEALKEQLQRTDRLLAQDLGRDELKAQIQRLLALL